MDDEGCFQRPYSFRVDNRKHPLCDHGNPLALVVAEDGCSLQCPHCQEIVVPVEMVSVIVRG